MPAQGDGPAHNCPHIHSMHAVVPEPTCLPACLPAGDPQNFLRDLSTHGILMIVGFCICMPCGILAVALKNLPFAMEHARLPLILHYTHMFFMVSWGRQEKGQGA